MGLKRSWTALATSVVLAWACGGQGGDDGAGPTGLTLATSSGPTSSSAGTGPKFDVEAGTRASNSAGEGGDEGCKKVDFLFVIDSSNSLNEEQAQLIGSFPGFVAGIQATLDQVDDYHVGITTSDAYAYNGDGCTQIGSLVTQTGGKDSSNMTCSPYADGFRYMTANDDLGTKFACAAQVGTMGANDEAMMQGATRAVAPDMNAANACNDSFIRTDALLVLVLITDEDDPGTCILGNIDCMGSPGDPMTWYDNLVMIKGGNPENLVVLSLVWGAPGNVCGPPPGTEKLGQRIMDFTNLFPHGFIGDICAPSYDQFFTDAIAEIDSACDGFMPPG